VGLTAAAGSRSHRGSWIAAALLALLPIGLWCVRNEIRVGRFTPNTNGAVNLYLGNNIHTPLVYAYRAMNDSAAWAPLLPLGETARADEALRRVTAYASRQPGRMLLGMVMRIPDALESDRILLGVARRGQFPQRPPRLLLVIAGVVLFVTLVPTTLAVACAINPPDHWLAHAGRWALIGTVLTQAITIAHSRFTLLAWLALLPGAAITWERLRSGDRATRNAVFVSTAVVFALLVRQWRLA
jgi:hypothetical protein